MSSREPAAIETLLGRPLSEVRGCLSLRRFHLRPAAGRRLLPANYKLRSLVEVRYALLEGRLVRLELVVTAATLSHPCLGPGCRLLLRRFLGAALARSARASNWAGGQRQPLGEGYVAIHREADRLHCRASLGPDKTCPRCQHLGEPEANYCSRCGKRLDARGFWAWLRG